MWTRCPNVRLHRGRSKRARLWAVANVRTLSAIAYGIEVVAGLEPACLVLQTST